MQRAVVPANTAAGQRKNFRVVIDTIERLMRRNARQALKKVLGKIHVVDLATILPLLLPDTRKKTFSMLVELNLAGEVLAEMPIEPVLELVLSLPPKGIAALLEKMATDDATEILSALPETIREEILQHMTRSESSELQAQLRYDEETAGRIMTTEYFALPENLEVGRAINEMQRAPDTVEIAYYVYVVDDRNRLSGVLSLRSLILNPPETLLKDICSHDVIRVSTDMDQEDVARLVARYNLLAVPVVDEDNRLVGIVTVDDIIDVIKEEATEDIFKLVGTDDEELEGTGWLRAVRLRLPWLFASFIGGLIGVSIANHFQVALSKVVALSFFIPVILGMGGNVGTQSSTIVVRGLATGRIDPRRVFSEVFREVRVGVSLGLSYGVILGSVAYFMYGGQLPQLGFVVGTSITASMTIAATMGTLIPLVLHRLNIDPAVATGPFITTAVDIIGISIYFSTAMTLLF